MGLWRVDHTPNNNHTFCSDIITVRITGSLNLGTNMLHQGRTDNSERLREIIALQRTGLPVPRNTKTQTTNVPKLFSKQLESNKPQNYKALYAYLLKTKLAP